MWSWRGLSIGRDRRHFVINYTHPQFSVGLTTSNTKFGVELVRKPAKRTGRHGKAFKGYVLQAGVPGLKFYFYRYRNGDGRD